MGPSIIDGWTTRQTGLMSLGNFWTAIARKATTCSIGSLRRTRRGCFSLIQRRKNNQNIGKHWKTQASPPPKKARVCKSVGKQMYIFFMDRHGMILQHAVPLHTTVNTQYYSKVLHRDLVRALRRKRLGMDLDRVLLHQDNTPSHTASTTQLEISLLGLETVKHVPYSLDLAPDGLPRISCREVGTERSVVWWLPRTIMCSTAYCFHLWRAVVSGHLSTVWLGATRSAFLARASTLKNCNVNCKL